MRDYAHTLSHHDEGMTYAIFQLYKTKATDKLEAASLRLREQDDDFNKQRQEFQREILHLRQMLAEREQTMELVAAEKRSVTPCCCLVVPSSLM